MRTFFETETHHAVAAVSHIHFREKLLAHLMHTQHVSWFMQLRLHMPCSRHHNILFKRGYSWLHLDLSFPLITLSSLHRGQLCRITLMTSREMLRAGFLLRSGWFPVWHADKKSFSLSNPPSSEISLLFATFKCLLYSLISSVWCQVM